MAEIVDYLFFFWVFLAIAVYVLGGLYEKYLKTLKSSSNSFSRQQQERSGSTSGDWRANLSSASPPLSFGRAAGDSQTWSHNADRLATSNLNDLRIYGAGELDVANHRAARAEGSSGISSYAQPGARLEKADGHSIPTASGFNGDCVEWVNSILYLFYTQPDKYGSIICESVIRSLNEKLSSITSSSAEYTNLMVEFSGYDRDASSTFELTNVRTETESDKSVSAICKLYNRKLVFDLGVRSSASASDHSGLDDDGAKHYELTLENLEGKVKSVAMLSVRLIVAQFMDKPDTKILLRSKSGGGLAPGGNQSTISEDSLVNLILKTISQVVVDLYFGDDPEFPQFQRSSAHTSGYRNTLNMLRGGANEIKRHIKNDFLSAISASPDNNNNNNANHNTVDYNNFSGGKKERKILVKVIRAQNINYNQNVTCLLELNVPHQLAVSATKPAGSNPFWEEHFLFNVTDKSSELVLELWDSISQPTPPLTTETQTPKISAKNSWFGDKQHQPVDASVSCSPGSTYRSSDKSQLTAGAKFLGLARIRVSPAELRKNPAQKLNLGLQTQQASSTVGGDLADLSNSVGGEVVVELLFLEHSAKDSSASLAGGLKKSASASSVAYQPGDVVSIDRKLTPSGYVITTTTITKSAGNSSSTTLGVGLKRRVSELVSSPLRDRHNSAATTATTTSRGRLEPTSTSSLKRSYSPVSYSNTSDSWGGNDASSSCNNNNNNNNNNRGREGRSRSRSRSFLRAIKKRFSFSRTRSRSVGESSSRVGAESPSIGPHRSAAIDVMGSSMDSYSRASSELSVTDPSFNVGLTAASSSSRAKSVPVNRDQCEVPTIVINKGGRLSESVSTYTFVHPKSQLVIECQEISTSSDNPSLTNAAPAATTMTSTSTSTTAATPNASSNNASNRFKYYAIPDDQAHKWRKLGVKLHVLNDHQFVAAHLSGSSTCHLCGRVFSRRLGKQGYRCRNCHLLSHKPCHVKVDHKCPYAARDGLKLQYVDADSPIDPKMIAAASKASTTSLRSTPNDNKFEESRIATGGRTLPARFGGRKSVSVDMDDR